MPTCCADVQPTAGLPGNCATGSLRRPYRGGNGLVVGERRLAIEPASLLRNRTQCRQLVAAHQPRTGQLAYGIARAKAHEHLTVLKHLESPTTHGSHLPGKKPAR